MEFPDNITDVGPLVSVIIPVHNGERYIEDTLRSVIDQTYPKLEIIVVDDASTDSSRDVLRGFANRITLLEHKVNAGVAASRNTGIRASKGDIIAILDQDDLWLPERVSKGVEGFYGKSGIGLVAVNTYIQDEKTGIRHILWKRIIGAGDGITKRLLKGNFICSAGSMVSRRALDEVGLFDESFFGADDYDMWYRIAKKFDFTFIEEPLAIWRYRPASLSSNTQRMFEDLVHFYDKVLETEDHEEERAIALSKRSEQLFKLGVTQSLGRDDASARQTFATINKVGAGSLEIKFAILLHAINPRLFRFVRSLRSGQTGEIMHDLEVVI